jgi:hypothetical protein
MCRRIWLNFHNLFYKPSAVFKWYKILRNCISESLVGPLGRGFGLSQLISIYTKQHKHRIIQTYIRVPTGSRSKSRVEQCTTVMPRIAIYSRVIHFAVLNSNLLGLTPAFALASKSRFHYQNARSRKPNVRQYLIILL